MASLIKSHISSKLAGVLEELATHRGEGSKLIEKIASLIQVKRVDKSTKEFGTFTLNLNDLVASQLLTTSKLNDGHSKQINTLRDDLIESCKVSPDHKVAVKVNVESFKKRVLEQINNEKESYGYVLKDDQLFYKPNTSNPAASAWKSKKQLTNTIVEFSSPNIAKPLHAGHMRSTFLGNFLSNIHQKLGHNVTRINYLGDWGTQYGILAVGFKKYGSIEKLNTSPIQHLLEVYVKANQDESLKTDALAYFSQMEAGNEDSLKQWQLFKDLSIKELDSVYKELNIKFDVYESESQYFKFTKIYVDYLLEKGLATKTSNGAVEVRLKKAASKPKAKEEILKYIIQKQDGSTLYISRDIAAFFERKKKYDFSKIVYVVDMSQRDHFYKLYETIGALDRKQLDNLNFEEFYVPFGRLTNMSTRRGKVEFLGELVNEAKQVALESMKNLTIKKDVTNMDFVAQTIGNSHLIISDLMRPRMKDYEFSWKNIVSKDDSAFMCHYLHARIHNLIQKSTEILGEIDRDRINLALLNKSIELALIQHLSRYEETVWQSFQESEPYHLVQYLFQLTKLENVNLSENYVVGEREDLAQARLFLHSCCKSVLANTFRLLGVNPLDRV